MIIRKPDGTMHFDNVADALEYDRAARGMNVAMKQNVPKIAPIAPKPHESHEVDEEWNRILEQMNAYQGKIVDTATLMKILDVNAVTGVGTKLRHLHARMADQGIDIHTYLIKQRAADGTPSWKVDVTGGLV